MPSTSASKIALIERRTKVIAMRRGGMSYRAIADAVRGKPGIPAGYTQAAAYRDVKALLEEQRATQRELADEVRQLELERLDAMHMALWTDAMRGGQGAIDRVLRISERRARLLGLDAPTKLAGADGGDFTIKVIYDTGGSAPENGAPDAT